MRAVATFCLVTVLAVATAFAQGRSGPEAAPRGDASAVARRVIGQNFDREACPRVTRARRLQDGTIHATCSNGETFRVFGLGGQGVAMRCSAAARHGIRGC